MNGFESLRASREAGHPAALALEQLAFAPEGAPRAPEVEAHVRACGSCQSRVAALREERARFLQARPARAFTDRILEQGRQPSWWERHWLWLIGTVPVLAAAAVVLLVALPGEVRQGGGTGLDSPRYKGASAVRLEVLVSRDGQPATLFPASEPLRQGDVLRFRVTIPEKGYAFIANLDDAGRFTRYFPPVGSRSAPLESGEHLLPGSIVLDGWRGEERITLLFSPRPLEEREVEAALRRAFEEARGLRFEEPGLPGQAAAHFHRKEGAP